MMLVRIKKLITSGFVRFIRGDNASIRLQAINKSTTSTQINKSATSTQINKATIATEISLRERFSLNAKLTTINSSDLSDNIISAVMLIILRLQLLLFGLLVAISTVAAAQFSYGNCEVKGSMAKGQCIHIRDCPNLYQIFTLNNQTKEQRQLLADSQCGVDNTRPSVPSVQRILVCCSVDDKPDDKPEPGNVLPRIGECGRMFDNRIIGGTKTQLFEFPWMALLSYKKPNNEYGFNCGGTLINSRYVLTAGHCLNSSKLEKSRWELHSVRLGEWDTSTAPDCVTELTKKTTCAPLHIDIDIEQRILHESYVPNSIDQMHDIALLRLKQLVTFTEYVKPICLPVADDVRNNNFEGYAMDVAGWGVTEDGSPSNTKLKITVDVWNLEQCQAKYRVYQLHLNGSQLCAGGKNQIDTCQGDSGGPLMVPIHVDNHEVFFVAGVTSYGPLPCGLQGWPGVYTRVGNYVDWVKTKLLA